MLIGGSPRWGAVIAALIWLTGHDALAQVNRCIDAAGRVEYRADACQGGNLGQPVLIPSTPQATGKTAKPQVTRQERHTYVLADHVLMFIDKDTGKGTRIPLPTSFPEFSWATAVAHDTDLDIVTVVTIGGEGLLYRYDAKRKRWLDYRSMKNLDVMSLTYDERSKIYLARLSDGQRMLISKDGEFTQGQWMAAQRPDPRRDASQNFGPPISPNNTPQWPVKRTPPPREMAHNAEIVVISGSHPEGGLAKVVVNRPGKRVLLVLSTYHRVLWQVEASAGTSISGIVLSSVNLDSGVIGNSPTPVHLVPTPYPRDVDNINFRRLIQQLNSWFGITKIDAFRGHSDLPASLDISTLDAERAELTLEGVRPTPPTSVLEFDVLARDLGRVRLRNDGATGNTQTLQKLLSGSKAVLSGSGLQAYTLTDEGFYLTDKGTGKRVSLPLPEGFPRFSWATTVSYDVDEDVVAVATLGGEGFFYRYDAKRMRWLDFRSLNNIDITAMAYNAITKRYMAFTSDGELLSLSTKGEVLSKKVLVKRLPSFGALYDRDNNRPPILSIASHGALTALIYVEDGDLAAIWTYDESKDQAQLTYKRRSLVPKAGLAR